jgi:hypothetical protein
LKGLIALQKDVAKTYKRILVVFIFKQASVPWRVDFGIMPGWRSLGEQTAFGSHISALLRKGSERGWFITLHCITLYGMATGCIWEWHRLDQGLNF